MTAERIEVAKLILADGKHIVDEILPELQKLSGPKITRSPLYAWTKDYKRLQPLEDETDDQ